MQDINLNKEIIFNSSITDLLLISIDDQIEIKDDKDGVKIIGDIAVSGKIKTIEGEKDFEDSINLDIFLMQEEISERNLLNVTVKDFNYKIEGDKLILNVSLKLDGLKEIETNFLTEENNEHVQEEIEELREVYIDADINVAETNSIDDEDREEYTEIEVTKNDENEFDITDIELGSVEYKEKEEPITKKSLLKEVFSSKKINEEVSWVLHCVKNENSYEEIANKYNVDLKELISINNNEKLTEGKLIFLPLN